MQRDSYVDICLEGFFFLFRSIFVVFWKIGNGREKKKREKEIGNNICFFLATPFCRSLGYMAHFIVINRNKRPNRGGPNNLIVVGNNNK